MNIEKFLENAELFAGLSGESRVHLAKICVPREFAKKEMLFHEGDPGHSLYFLVSGNIELSKSSPDGRDIVIRVMKAGEMFGEVVLFEKSDYPVTAIAVRKSFVIIIPKKQFNEILEDTKFRNEFIAIIMRKMRYLAERIKYLSLHDVEDRFRLFLGEHYGRKPMICPTLSKKDIAAAIAATPETFSRLITRLDRENLMHWTGKNIAIHENFWNPVQG
jgi:CRP/FNR family transcriptional regulator